MLDQQVAPNPGGWQQQPGTSSVGQSNQAGQTPSGIPEAVQAALQHGVQSAGLMNQGYMSPLTRALQFQPGTTKIDPANLALIQAYFGGLKNHPLESGGFPHPDSPIFNQLADGNAKAISQQAGAGAVAQGVWQNTVGSFIKQAQDNPLLTVAEVAGTVGLFAAAGALDVSTGGLATPLLWTGFAMFAAPTILPLLTEGIANAVHNPSDITLTQLLIAVGTAGITLGSPVKAFKGIAATRLGLEADAQAIRFFHQPGQAVNLLVRNKAGKEINYLLPEDRPLIPQTVADLEQEVATRKAQGEMSTEEDDALIEKYRTSLQEHDILMGKVQGLNMEEQGLQAAQQAGAPIPRGDMGRFRSRADYLQEVSDRLSKIPEERQGLRVSLAQQEEGVQVDKVKVGGMIPIMKEIGNRYGYLLAKERPLARITQEQLDEVGPVAAAKADKEFRTAWGIAHYAGELNGWNSGPEGAAHEDFAQNMAHAMARGDAAGGLEHGMKVLHTSILTAAKHLGLKESDMNDIWAAIDGHKNPEEDAKLWDKLSSHQKLFAEKFHILSGIMTNHAYRHGHIELPMTRYIARMVVHDNPDETRGTRSTQNLQEALAPSVRGAPNRQWAVLHPDDPTHLGDQQSDWGVANESQDSEFDPEEELGTARERTITDDMSLSERLVQRHAPWNEFNDKEQTKKVNYTEYAPMRDILKDKTPKDILGESKTVNQFLEEKRKEFGTFWRQKNLMEKRLQEAPQQLGNLVTQINENRKRLENLTTARSGLKGIRSAAPQRAQLDAQLKDLRNQVRKDLTKHTNLAGSIKNWEAKLADAVKKTEEMPAKWAKQAGVDHIPNAADYFNPQKVGRDDIKARIASQPGGRRLLSGFDVVKMMGGRFMRQMNQASYRKGWESVSHMQVSDSIHMAYGAKGGLTLADYSTKALGDRPVALTSDIPLGDAGTDPHKALYDNGYEMVMPAMGRKGALNYKPAIFGRTDLVGEFRRLAQNARNSSDFQSAWMATFYKATVGIPKRAIMGSPMWHGKNITGHALAVLVQHPGAAASTLTQLLRNRFHDPEAYHMTKLEHWQAGGVPANRFNVTDHLNWLEQEMSGQRNFGYVMRHPIAALGHAHAEAAEGWFWKTVDDVGTMAYLVQKHEFETSKPWMSGGMASMLSAEYSNNVSGMVNPLYMTKLWKWGRQMIFFAPTWWSTFYRTVGMSMPGMSRLSKVLSETRFKGLDPVKMASIDMRHRKEMVRIHRSYFMAMMSAAMVTHDAMNFLFSGHHVWENGKGHEWDLELDKLYPPKPNASTGQTQHARMHSIQLYSQIADLLNGMGIGHDWGFAHTMMQDDNYKKADAAHKLSLIGNALMTGANNEASGKMSTAINLIGGVGLGVDPYALVHDQQIQHIPRMEALLGALPGGYAAQRQIDQYRRAQTKAQITGQPGAAAAEQAKILPTFEKALAGQFIGLPTAYYSGDEPVSGFHYLTEDETTKYLQQRQTILSRKKVLSDKLMTGAMSPNDWVVQNEMQTQGYLQLLSDTFGDQSVGKSLFDARRNLYKKYKLDDPTLSRQEQEYNLQQFEADWEAQLANSSPEAKAAWWEGHTAMWTDADYLHQMSSQMRQAVASHIDGQGGSLIRDAQRRLGSQGLPLDPAATDALRAQDPYLWTYQQVMSQLGKNTLLGALTAAYHDPFASFNVFPDDQIPGIQALDQAGLLKGGSTLVSQSQMQGMTGQAEAQLKPQVDAQGKPLAAQDQPEGVQAGGQLSGTPDTQAAAAGITAAEAATLLEANQAATPAKQLSPEAIAWLQRIAAGGRPI